MIEVPILKDYFLHEGLAYEICLTTTSKMVELFVMQSEDFSLLAPRVSMLVKKSFTFVTHIKGQMLINILDCEMSSNIIYGSRRDKLVNSHSDSF
jgi:hypothetical protein